VQTELDVHHEFSTIREYEENHLVRFTAYPLLSGSYAVWWESLVSPAWVYISFCHLPMDHCIFCQSCFFVALLAVVGGWVEVQRNSADMLVEQMAKFLH